MTKYFAKDWEFLTLKSDNTFKIDHCNYGWGMHDASHEEFWIAKGTWTHVSENVFQLTGTYTGTSSGSGTDIHRKVTTYHRDFKDELYSRTIDVSSWKIHTSPPDPNAPPGGGWLEMKYR